MIRNATAADVPVIHEMIRELAEYEKALHEARATEAQLHEALFGERPAAFAFIAETPQGRPPGSPCGSSTSPHGAGFTGSTWRTSTYARNCAAAGTARPC